MSINFLSDRDRQTLLRMIEQSKHGDRTQIGINTPLRQTGEVYVAYPESSRGIPGFYVDTGTGTPYAGPLRPGKGIANVFRLLPMPDGSKGLFPVYKQILVYNIGGIATGQRWLPLMKTSYGQWVVITPEEEADSGTGVTGTGTGGGTGTGTGTGTTPAGVSIACCPGSVLIPQTLTFTFTNLGVACCRCGIADPPGSAGPSTTRSIQYSGVTNPLGGIGQWESVTPGDIVWCGSKYRYSFQLFHDTTLVSCARFRFPRYDYGFPTPHPTPILDTPYPCAEFTGMSSFTCSPYYFSRSLNSNNSGTPDCVGYCACSPFPGVSKHVVEVSE